MKFRLLFTPESESQLRSLEKNPGMVGRCKAVKKALGYMEVNLRHPGLRTHKYESLKGPNGEDLFESYAQQKTPGAYRIFWYYGPAKDQITVVAIIPHP